MGRGIPLGTASPEGALSEPESSFTGSCGFSSGSVTCVSSAGGEEVLS